MAIGSEIFDAGNSKTFHEGLPVYLRVLLGEEWIKKDLEKELLLRHPILQWQNAMIACRGDNIQCPGKSNTFSNRG